MYGRDNNIGCLRVASCKIGTELSVRASKVCMTSIGERFEYFITNDGFAFITKDGFKFKVLRKSRE